MTNQLHPIWFRLPKRFYGKLELSAESAGLSPEDVLEFALDIFGRFVVTAQRNSTDTKAFVARIWPVLRALQKDAALAVLRWAKIPQEERSKRARELALKRWGAKKKRRPKAVGEQAEG
jgi:hypothetical protein